MRGYLHHVTSNKGVYSFVFSSASGSAQRPQNSNTIVLDLTKPMSVLTYNGNDIPVDRTLDLHTTDYFDHNASDLDKIFARGIFNTFDRIVQLRNNNHIEDSENPDRTEFVIPMTTPEYMSICFKWIEKFLKILFTLPTDEVKQTFNDRNIKAYSNFGINLHTVRNRTFNFEMVTTSPADMFKDLSIYTKWIEDHPSWRFYEAEEIYYAYKEYASIAIITQKLPIYSSLPNNSIRNKILEELSDSKVTLGQLVSRFTDVQWNTLNKILKELLPMLTSDCLNNDFLTVGMGLFKACVVLNQPLDSGSIFRQLPIVGKAYQQFLLAKNEELIKECDEYFKKLQTESINLSFEDDNYKTVVPVSYKELVDMGKLMHNCLADHEWKNVLTKGIRRVVFIQSKNPKIKRNIACDIDITDGEIQQFLTHNNDSVYNEDFPGISQFKKDFQQFVYNQYFLSRDKFERLSPEKAQMIAKLLDEKCSDNYIDSMITIDLKDFIEF